MCVCDVMWGSQHMEDQAAAAGDTIHHDAHWKNTLLTSFNHRAVLSKLIVWTALPTMIVLVEIDF